MSDNTVSKFVAPYYADADIRESGEVYFRQTNDPSLLQRANSEIRAAFSLPQNTTMQNLLIVTWFRVGYYSFNEIEDNKVHIMLCLYTEPGKIIMHKAFVQYKQCTFDALLFFDVL